MKKIILGLGGLLFIGILSGCGGDDFNCENKEYAKEALNLILFDERDGSDDKNVTLETLGFEISDITLLKIDKDKKKSVCRAEFSNIHINTALEKIQQLQNSEEKDIAKGLDKETSERLGAFALTTTLTVTGFNPDTAPILQTTVFGMEEIYQATKNLGQMDKALKILQQFYLVII